jgi:hypothetical protein
MPGIYIAALITSVLALAAVGTILWQVTQRDDRGLITLLLVASLPLSMATFYGVRKPLDRLLVARLGKDSPALTAIRLGYAPLTEEPAKLLPLLLLLVPRFHGRLTQKSVISVAMALGLGFALGEIWLVAGFVAQDPKLGDLPFYMYGGFLAERLQTCFIHCGFTVTAVAALARGWRWFPLGMIAAMTLHFLGNFPIFLMKQDTWGLGKETWGTIVGMWVAAFAVGSLVLLGLIYFGPAAAKKLFTAKVLCPDCGERYKQPIFGLNMGMKRYEQCPLCKKWHWIDIRDMLKSDVQENTNPAG